MTQSLNVFHDALAPSCNSADTTVILIAVGLVGLVLTFCGYLLYRMTVGLFGFILAFLAEAAIGALWMGETLFQTSDAEALLQKSNAEGTDSDALKKLIGADGSDSDVAKKVIVIACCLIWGILGAVFFCKLSAAINKYLGFVMGAALGVGLVVIFVFALKNPINDAAGSNYAGWEQFATISFGVPVAFATGYLARNSIKYGIMLATALGGAAVVVSSVMGAFDCAEVDLGDASKPIPRAVMAVALAVIGFLVQLKVEPKLVREPTKQPEQHPQEVEL